MSCRHLSGGQKALEGLHGCLQWADACSSASSCQGYDPNGPGREHAQAHTSRHQQYLLLGPGLLKRRGTRGWWTHTEVNHSLGLLPDDLSYWNALGEPSLFTGSPPAACSHLSRFLPGRAPSRSFWPPVLVRLSWPPAHTSSWGAPL